jgi:Retrotransposon gag protein/Zinc knuckle
MDSEPLDRISKLESGLSDAREQAKAQQNTLDEILRHIQGLSATRDSQPPVGPPPAMPRVAIPTEAEPRAPTRGLKPAAPNEFDGDRLKGRAFLNSCRLYISLCADQFRDEQAQVHWALSFMKSGRAALYANQILRKETSDGHPAFFYWRDFEQDFTAKFCPKNEATSALTKLESTRYYQGRKAVDDYIDEFTELIEEAGYSDGLSIVMKFRKGLDREVQDRIAEMVLGRPGDDDPEGWYDAARVFDANKMANQAFHGTQRTVTSFPTTRPPVPTSRTVPMTHPAAPVSHFRTSQYPGIPTRASNVPTPMEIDSARRRNPIPMICRRCGETGHFARECPRGFDVRYMSSDEREDWIEHLLSQADVAAVADRPLTPTPEAPETAPQASEGEGEDFTSHSG